MARRRAWRFPLPASAGEASPAGPSPEHAPLPALLTALVHNTRDAVVVLSPDGGVRVWNPAAARLFGYSEAEVLGTHVGEVLWAPGDSAIPRTAADLLAVHAGAEPYTTPLPYRRAAQVPQALYRLSVTLLPDGYVLLLATREQRGEPASTMESALPAAQETFYLAVAHELRTPATVASGFLQLLRHRIGEQAPGLTPLADTAQRGMNRLCRVLDNLLTYGLVQRGDLQLDLSSFDLSTVLTELAAEMAAREDRLILAVSLPAGDAGDGAGPCPIRADCDRTAQLVGYLLQNALDYSAPPAPVALVWGQDDRGGVVIHVTDQGEGLAPTVQETLFGTPTPAYTTRSRGRLGLGLFLARLLARAHGGDVTLLSTGAAGSTFQVWLPCWPPAWLDAPIQEDGSTTGEEESEEDEED